MPKEQTNTDQLLLNACRLRDDGKFREALNEFSRVAEAAADPIDKAIALVNAAAALRTLREDDTAMKHLQAARTLANSAHTLPTDDRLLHLKVELDFEEAELCWVRGGHQDEALAKFNGFLDKYSASLREPQFRDEYEIIQAHRAFLLTNLGRWQEALPILEEAEAESFEAYKEGIEFYLGHCYVCVRDYVRAKPRLIDALRLGLPPHLEYRAHNALGIAYFGLGEYAQAKPEFEKAAETADPAYLKDSQIWKRLEVTCRQLGLTQEADRFAKLAKAGVPRSGFLHSLWRRPSV